MFFDLFTAHQYSLFLDLMRKQGRWFEKYTVRKRPENGNIN